MSSIRRTAIGLLFVTVLAGCGGGGVGVTVSDPDSGVFVGNILDDDGNAVVGALVSVDGVQADDPTDSTGRFVVSDGALAEPLTLGANSSKVAAAGSHEITVLAPGFEPVVSTWSTAAGSVATIEIVRQGLEPSLSVSSPTGAHSFVIPADCENPVVQVRGVVDLIVRDNFMVDLVVVIDRSGSTADETFDVSGDEDAETVLETEVHAVECLLETVDWDSTRVGVVAFSDTATQLVGLTGDSAVVDAAISAIGNPNGGTNYEAAFAQAEEMFETARAADEEDAVAAEEGEDPVNPDRRRVLIFLTDGVPTAHGVPRDTEDSNLTQSADDRAGAIEAARSLGETVEADLYGYIFQSDSVDAKFTTLPHCAAVCGAGQVVDIDSSADLDAEICAEALVDELEVEVQNTTLGGAPVVALLSPGGEFVAEVPVAANLNGTARDNVLVVTATAFPGDLDASVEESVTISVADQSVVGEWTISELLDAQEAPVAVADLDVLVAPTGRNVQGSTLIDFLQGEFEDSVEVSAVETFSTYDPTSTGQETVTLTVNLIYNDACYRSDVGYVVVDPDDLPSNHVEALEDATADNVLFNSGDISGINCSIGSVPDGTAEYSITVPTGSVIVLFLIPNRTLGQYQASPYRSPKPMFSLTSLNSRGFQQIMTFTSEDGRTEAGASTVLVDAGEQLIVAFEDIELSRWNRTGDYNDVVLSISSGVVPRFDALSCD